IRSNLIAESLAGSIGSTTGLSRWERNDEARNNDQRRSPNDQVYASSSFRNSNFVIDSGFVISIALSRGPFCNCYGCATLTGYAGAVDYSSRGKRVRAGRSDHIAGMESGGTSFAGE